MSTTSSTTPAVPSDAPQSPYSGPVVDRARRRGGGGASRTPAKPRPPSSLELAVLPDHRFDHEGTYRRLGYVDADLSGGAAESVEVEQCRFRGTDLSTTTLDRARFTDCLVEHSNLANLRASDSSWARVRVVASRMTGFTWADGSLRDVVFDECRLDLSGWRFTDFHAVAFTGCNLARADFYRADLSGARFVGCDLTGAQFSQATMKGTRFVNCTLAGIGGLTSWDGAVVQGQDLIALAYELAGALGIGISDEDDS
ncbi:pentapeptide repeat-containing protein [Planosporangium thailandense]|uniref:Pentapeptide repeat-containing protein n=1 Tax=Planosporangium thailandense TaxID=765197 RepID=A0ABX0Y7R2_9ACTN|nr:pentapeptide repeat-containing protein [Planosporangium thailandense]NJC73585.1 pentapeptide repeat-containing protein [Planosporangium thailandense]